MELKVLTEREAARYIGMSVYYLQRDRCCGVTGKRTPGPAFIKVGRRLSYLLSDLNDWIGRYRIVV